MSLIIYAVNVTSCVSKDCFFRMVRWKRCHVLLRAAVARDLQQCTLEFTYNSAYFFAIVQVTPPSDQ